MPGIYGYHRHALDGYVRHGSSHMIKVGCHSHALVRAVKCSPHKLRAAGVRIARLELQAESPRRAQ